MIKNVATTVPLLLLVGLAAGCEKKAPSYRGFQGVVEFEERVLGFEVPGRVRARPVERGDAIQAGTVLAQLDDSLAIPARDARRAELRAAKAQLALLEA